MILSKIRIVQHELSVSKLHALIQRKVKNETAFRNHDETRQKYRNVRATNIDLLKAIDDFPLR